jgi:hypothetical protein
MMVGGEIATCDDGGRPANCASFRKQRPMSVPELHDAFMNVAYGGSETYSKGSNATVAEIVISSALNRQRLNAENSGRRLVIQWKRVKNKLSCRFAEEDFQQQTAGRLARDSDFFGL